MKPLCSFSVFHYSRLEIRKILLYERNIFNLKGFPVEVLQGSRVLRESEGEGIGIKRLTGLAVFRETYLGNYRNSRDNQMMLVASLNSSYFRQLMQQSILDPDYANAASIDVDAQRAAWVASGKSDAADWDDDTVKANPFKRTVYLTANVKILGSMTDLIFPITMA